MVDFKIILSILQRDLYDCSVVIMTKDWTEWVKEDALIIFPLDARDYTTKINKLRPLQYIQRTHLLFTNFLKQN